MANLKQYVTDATRTESRIKHVTADTEILFSTIQIMISAGHILDQIKKNVFYGKPFNNEKLRNELDTLSTTIDHLNDEWLLGPQIPERIEKFDPRVFHAIIGIATESTELLEALISENPDKINMLEEVGDLCWYSGVLIDSQQGDWDQILETNIKKLKARFPNKFESEQAINRNLDVERNILQDGLDH